MVVSLSIVDHKITDSWFERRSLWHIMHKRGCIRYYF